MYKRQHRDELKLGLKKDSAFTSFTSDFGDLSLKEIQVKTGVEKLFSHLTSKLNPITKEHDGKLLCATPNLSQFFSPDAYELTKIQKEKQSMLNLINEKRDKDVTSSYFKNRLHLLSMQEAVLRQRVFHPNSIPAEFIGADLSTLKSLYFNYLKDRDEGFKRIHQLSFVKQQIEKEGVEWVFLGNIFPDSLSNNMVLELSRLVQQMRKNKNITKKELVCMESEFSEKKKHLHQHVKQALHLQNLQDALIHQRIRLVQATMFNLLNKDIALIEQQIEDRITDQLQHVIQEKARVQGQIKQIGNEMKRVPETWLKERQLQFSADIYKGMLESLLRLVESKNIEAHLMTVESKALDWACAPLDPEHPKLTLITLLGMLIGIFLSFGACFVWIFCRGVPLTLENLMVRGKKTLGQLSKKSVLIQDNHANLEVLRNISLLLKEQKQYPLVVTLVLGEGEDYSPYLAQLLEREGYNILVVDLDFSKKSRDKPGLIHYLEGEIEQPAQQKKSYGSFISMGGYSLFGDEILKHKRFREFLDRVKKEYDVVLLVLPKSAKESLPKTFFSFSNVMIIRLARECFSDLSAYFLWDNGEEGVVAFLS